MLFTLEFHSQFEGKYQQFSKIEIPEYAKSGMINGRLYFRVWPKSFIMPNEGLIVLKVLDHIELELKITTLRAGWVQLNTIDNFTIQVKLAREAESAVGSDPPTEWVVSDVIIHVRMEKTHNTNIKLNELEQILAI